jgi:signal transduction histidine kinase/CheY-like chemotaxis protein
MTTMIQFEKNPDAPWYIAIGLSLIIVLVADQLTPLGYAEWILYMVPVALTVFMRRPDLPLIVGAISSLLLIVGYYVSPLNEELKDVAVANRILGLITIWLVAAVCYRAVRNKLMVSQKEWLQVGQAKINSSMVGELKLDQLCTNVLEILTDYLGAKAAAIFVEDGAVFRRTALYAIPAIEAVPERFQRGQGLLGQAVEDVRSFLIEEVPEGYLTIGSGFGSALPRSLFIQPTISDELANGVIELGFINQVPDPARELMRLVAPSIGIAIKSAKYRARLQELLEETQRQGEELQAQTEELRISNEELGEQSRALRETQLRLELQQTELEQTNSQLEEQSQLLEMQKDDLAQANHDLESHAEKLQQVSQYKSEFLANMSHELRTPLNSSLILSKLLSENREGNLTEEQIKFANTIHSAGNDLLNLINDILDLAKIESGKLEIHVAQVQTRSLVEDLKDTFEPLARSKSLNFGVQLAADSPPSLRTDYQRLEQILRNLVSNAIKFTSQGGVTVSVSSDKDGQLAFSVTDTGIGISASQQEVIFEAFRQADGTTNRKYGGTGLGLSISKHLASLLNGEISVESRVGVGSTFTLKLPIEFEPRSLLEKEVHGHLQPDKTVEPESLANSSPASRSAVSAGWQSQEMLEDDRDHWDQSLRTLLIIEDDETFAKILCDLSREVGFQCLLATTADEGIQLATRYRPNAILLDVGLPDQSGLSVLDRLKRDLRTRHIPIHVISAADYSETALSLGAIGYLVKPVQRQQLINTFEGLQQRLSQQVRRVLIVEDDPAQLEAMQHLLGSVDVEAVGAQSGAECLEALDQQTFDCMVLDLNLPDATGFTLLEKLSLENRYAFPPVIVYTARDLTTAEEEQLRQYASSIILKGAKSPERLLDEVTLFLHQVVSKLPADKQEMLKLAQSRDSILDGKRVLIVEDDVRNVFAISSILEPWGIHVSIARNGREAIQKLADSQPSDSAIDLVLMDLMMPEMDGLTAIREIRKHAEWKRMPIIALTAKAMLSDQQQCLEAGANDYMAKPLEVEKLLSLVRVWMPR